MKLDKKCSEIIKKFKLSPHPEGGWFKEVLRSKNFVTREDGQKRNNITGIYYLLCNGGKSSWHRVNFSDEIWIYLQGEPLELWILDNMNDKIKNLRLDSINPIEIIPAGYWQAARTCGTYTLTSCCVAPGFDFMDFEMLRNIEPSLRPAKAINELI